MIIIHTLIKWRYTMKERTITINDYFDGEKQVTQAEYVKIWSKDSQASKLIEYGEHFDSMSKQVEHIDNLIGELAKQSFNIVWERNAERELETIGEK